MAKENTLDISFIIVLGCRKMLIMKCLEITGKFVSFRFWIHWKFSTF